MSRALLQVTLSPECPHVNEAFRRLASELDETLSAAGSASCAAALALACIHTETWSDNDREARLRELLAWLSECKDPLSLVCCADICNHLSRWNTCMRPEARQFYEQLPADPELPLFSREVYLQLYKHACAATVCRNPSHDCRNKVSRVCDLERAVQAMNWPRMSERLRGCKDYVVLCHALHTLFMLEHVLRAVRLPRDMAETLACACELTRQFQLNCE